MVENSNAEYIKIRIPYIIDDPLVGRVIAPIIPPPILDIFHDWLIIENRMLTFKESITSSKSSISINLENIAKILLIKKKISYFNKRQQVDLWSRGGTEAELLLVDIEGKSHVLIPKLFIDGGEKEWNRFLIELSKYSGFPIEETT